MANSSIRILHVVGSLNKSSGGPSRSVSGLCEALGALGATVHILSQQESSHLGSRIIPNPKYVNTHLVRLLLANKRWRLYYAPTFKRTVEDICRQHCIQIVHDNGIWLPYNHAAVTAARGLRIPLVIQPRGTLKAWTLNYHAWKKKVAWNLYQKRDLSRASLLVATSDQEAVFIRDLGFRQPIAVIPNGVSIPTWTDRLTLEKEIRYALFLSRIHPVKGLMNLVAAWDQIRPKGWQMIVAGSDEAGHLREVQKAATLAGLDRDFKFVGTVEGEVKEQLYRDADLFILPTFSENFGVAVAEALSYGLPVITTTGAPWKEIVTNRSGWWVEPAVEPIANAIREAVSLSDLERHEMGQRGRCMVEREFSWYKIGGEMLRVYQWMTGLGPKPDCVLVT